MGVHTAGDVDVVAESEEYVLEVRRCELEKEM